MSDIDRSQLQNLYPKAKSYVQLRQEQRVRAELRRPKRVALKLSRQISFGLTSVLLAFALISFLMSGDVSSTGLVISMVSASLLAAMVAGAIIIYSVTYVRNLASRAFASAILFNFVQTILILTTFITSAFIVSSGSSVLSWVAIVLIVDFILSVAVTQWILSIQPSEF